MFLINFNIIFEHHDFFNIYFTAWDANGKYSSGLFWGNGFWTGSKSLCDNLNLNETGDLPFALGFNIIHLDFVFLGSSAPDVCIFFDIFNVRLNKIYIHII